MIDIQLFVCCATCGWQQGCPREDLPPSALEGGACEAGGPGPRGGFLLPHVLSPQRLPCSPTPARHLMTCLNPPNPLFKEAHQASVRTRAHGHHFAVLRPASDDALFNPPIPLFTGLPGPAVFPSPQWLSLPASFAPASDDLSQSP